MPKRNKSKNSAFTMLKSSTLSDRMEPLLHKFGNGIVCDTDKRGHAQPKGKSPTELVVDASNGFIPLWAQYQTLRWRFNQESLQMFADPEAAANKLRTLFGEGLLLWGDFIPIRFIERDENWDFQITVSQSDNCSPNGCVLASAFFPDSGRHELKIYPKLFSLSKKERVETMAHEIGHIFGLRHFFANVSEQAWPSEIFGTHSKFSIMNYGQDSYMTQADRADLKNLYQAVWSGQLTEINGTRIELQFPFSATHSDEPVFQTAAMTTDTGEELCFCQKHCQRMNLV